MLVVVAILLLLSNAVANSYSQNGVHQMAENAFLREILLTGNPVDLYNIFLQVGKKDFDVLFDTGSSNIVLPGINCVGCGSVSSTYQPGSGSKNLRIPGFVKYGITGDITGAYGNFYIDDVLMPEYEESVQLVIMSVSASGLQGPKSTIRAGAPMRGIFGAGPEDAGFLNKHGIGRLGNDSFVNALAKVDSNLLLVVQLCNYNGYLWLGGYKHKHVRTDFEYIPMAKTVLYYDMHHIFAERTNYSYSVIINSMSLDKQEIPGFPIDALIDTGTNYLVLPSARWFGSVIANGSKALDSSNCVLTKFEDSADIDEHFPSLTVSFVTNLTDLTSTATYKIPASESYMVQQESNDSTTLWCAVVSSGDSVIFGAPLMRHFIIKFDIDHKQIGFALQDRSTCPPKPSPAPPPPPPPPEDHGHKLRWWVILLWVILSVTLTSALVYAVMAAERYGNGPTAWYMAIFQKKSGFRERGDLEESLRTTS